MDNPEYVKINNKKYKINTDFRIALECNRVAADETIGDYERTLAIIYLLYGDDGLNDKENYQQLLELAIKYLKCGEDIDSTIDEEVDMDFEQDFKLIEASFRSDYGISLSKEKMHWWDFFMYLNGLSDKCVLNRVREIRDYDISELKDIKEKRKLEKAKKMYALKKKKTPITIEQQKSIDNFYKLTGIKRKE